MGFDVSKAGPLLYSPPDTINKDYVWIDFFCLVSCDRWRLNESSKVYLRFCAPELGTFYTCHGPMIHTKRFVIVRNCIHMLQNNDLLVISYYLHVTSV